MKTISILASARTGSTFLSRHFKSLQGYCYSAGEIFNAYLPKQIKIIHDIFYQNNIPLSTEYMNFLLKSKPVLLNVKQNQTRKLYNYKNTNPYCIEMFFDIQKQLNNLHYRYFINKNVLNEYFDHSWICKIVEASDVIIINYRKSILDSYISLKKAKNIGQWMLTYDKDYNPKYDELITWNKEEYMDFVKEYKENYTMFANCTLDYKKPYHIINYEELCSFDSLSFIEKTMGSGYALEKPNIKKQSRTLNRVDNFCNKNTFEKDMLDIDELDKNFSIETLKLN
tara:strand:+ start:4987 stop:5835 length:849 start_codon:yes stop_codon:yes gene_type:complete